MAKSIQWHGLTLAKNADGAYRHEKIAGFRVMAMLWTGEWQAEVGLGKCYDVQATPQEALDKALEEHEAKREAHMATARSLTAFRAALAQAKETPVPPGKLTGKGFSV